ncbi:MAG TPA: hypothetical protein VJ385_20370 [Fibrobacteria bacterium]|nr:hypothetical protein [Fibrobacteria bacterium]
MHTKSLEVAALNARSGEWAEAVGGFFRISLEEINGRREEAAALAARLLDSLNKLEFAPVG